MICKYLASVVHEAKRLRKLFGKKIDFEKSSMFVCSDIGRVCRNANFTECKDDDIKGIAF